MPEVVFDAPLAKLQLLAELRAKAARLNADPAHVFAKLDYTPTERQQVFHAATEFDVLYGGAAGGGKTKALLMQGIAWCMAHPGIRVGAFRRTYVELKDSLLAELARVGFASALGATWKGTDYDLRFPNGSVLMFRYAENMQDATRRQGAEFQGMLFDELTLTPPDVVTFLYSRVRSGRADIPVVGIRSGSNPGGPGHGTVKRKFIDATNYGENVVTGANGQQVRFIPSKISDNPHLNADYERQLDALPESQRKAFRDGSWDVFAGQMFTEWDHNRHVVPVFELPADWARYAGIDWGYAAPWGVIWGAVDEDRRVWLYRELYDTQVGEAEQAQRIVAAEAGEQVTARYADDAMWTARGDAKAISRIYHENGCSIRPAKKGERVPGWQRVHSFLADGPACPHHRAAGWQTCPMLHVLDGTCPNLVRTLPNLPYDEKRAEDADTKAEDHLPDALRYMLINLRKPSREKWLNTTPDTEAAPPSIDPLAPAPYGWTPDTPWTEVI